AKAFAGSGQRRQEEGRIAELERKVGRQALEIDFLQRCFQDVEEQRKLQALTTRGSSTCSSKRKCALATPIPLQRLGRLTHVSRAGYYRWLEGRPAVDHDLDLRDEIQDRAGIP